MKEGLQILKIFKRFGRIFNYSQYHQLDSILQAFSLELEEHISRLSLELDSNNTTSLINNVKDALHQSQVLLGNNHIQEAWKCYKISKQILVNLYTQSELDVSACLLRLEAKKLKSSWKTDAVLELLGDQETDNPIANNQLDIASKRTYVYNAMRLIDEYYDNQYLTINLRRTNIITIFIILTIMVISFPLMITFSIFPELSTSVNNASTIQILVGVIYCGFLGASLSVAFSLTRSIINTVPQELLSSFMIWLRPITGAAAAISTYILMKADFLSSIISPDFTTTIPGILALAFISGFTERFIFKIVDKLPGNQNTEVEPSI